MFSWLREILTAGIFYTPFLIIIGFGIFVFILGIATFIAGTFIFILFATYGFYAALRDVGFIQYIINQFKNIQTYLDLDILENMNKSFLMKDTHHIPEKQALYLCHPHGILGASWAYYLCNSLQPWYTSGKRPYLAIHSIFFRFPFLRELLEANHFIASSEETIRSYLQKGESVAIITGGAEEMKLMEEDKINLILKKRKGYSRLAKENNIPIVILFNTNEHKLFPPHNSFLWRFSNNFLYSLTHTLFPMPSWKAIKNWIQLIRKPLEEPMTTFALKPVETQGKSLEDIQKECILRLEEFIKEKKLVASIVA